jgi:hypothetical protein
MHGIRVGYGLIYYRSATNESENVMSRYITLPFRQLRPNYPGNQGAPSLATEKCRRFFYSNCQQRTREPELPYRRAGATPWLSLSSVFRLRYLRKTGDDA